MRNKLMSIFICAMIVVSISSSITQNVGEPSSSGTPGLPLSKISGPNPQMVGQPSSSLGGSGGLADSPWPMFRQNLNHTGLSPYDTSGNDGNLKWSYTTGGNVESSPTIDSDGTIYVSSWDHKLYAFKPNGMVKWIFTTGGDISSAATISNDGTIYVSSADYKLYAIYSNGSKKWEFETGYYIEHTSPTIGPDGTVYVGSDDNYFYAINPNGTEKWRFATKGNIYSSPAINSDGTIYVGSMDYKLYAIDPDGNEKWNFTTGDSIASSPAIASDGTIYVGSYDDSLYAIRADGTEKWAFKTGKAVFSSPAIGVDGTIYVGSWDNKFYAINPNGVKKWSFTANDLMHSSPAIGSDGTIYAGSHDNKLYAISSNGTEKWNFTTGGFVRSSPAIDSNGTIYVGSYDDKLYAIGAPDLSANVTSHFTSLNSAAQSLIKVHVTDGTNPVQSATVNLDSDNGGIFSTQSGITDANGDFKSIFNAPTVTSQIICRISAETSKTGYNDGSGYVDVTINPIPWPMYSHNCMRTSLSPYDTSSNPGKLKWSFTTSGFVMSPVIGHDETIYVGSWDDKLYAINPDGAEKWNYSIGKYMSKSLAIGSDGSIYAGTENCILFALNPDGTEKWQFYTDGPVKSSPTIGSDGTIYFGTSSGINSWHLLYALNPDGTEKWRFRIDIGGQASSPGIGLDGTIYFGSSDSNLYALNPDGTEKWRFTAATDNVESAPAIDSDGTIYVGSRDHNIYAIYPNGTEKWRFTTGDSIDWETSVAIGSYGTIYIGSDDHNLYAINPDGTEQWRFPANSLIETAPAIGSEGTIYFGSHDNNLYAVHPNGSAKWIFPTGWMVTSSPAIGSEGTIYVGSWDNNLYAINEGGMPPIAIVGPNQTINESDTVQFDASTSYDPHGTIVTYEWDFDSSDGLWWETGATPDATGPTATHIYGDDGVFIVTLRVTDNENLSTTDTCNVTVKNIDPPVTIESISMNVEIGLRVAGRKYNNVSMALYEDDSLLGYVSIERMPGSPDEQMAWIPVSINFSKTYNETVIYTPEDPPNIGGNPVWIYIKFQNGSIKKIHHTFNAQQSKKRDSEHWNHVEPWKAELNAHFIGLPFEIISHITDPGSDDETLTYTYGSQVKTITYLNNPPNPDPFPSPEIKPIDIMVTISLVYEGPGTVNLVVKDDDNIRLGVGQGSDFINVG